MTKPSPVQTVQTAKSLQSKIPQLLNVSITITSILKETSGQVWKETTKSLIRPHVKPSCVSLYGRDILSPSWCMTL
jgi:hypothetical protein